ncbi:MAG: hypothetical protein AB1749_01050 [Pseudomonadota bacterium]
MSVMSVTSRHPFVSCRRLVGDAGMLCLLAAAVALTGTPAAAHSKGQCANSVVEACNSSFPNNYEGRIACVNNGLDACEHHSHGGGGGKKSASDNLTSSGGGADARRPSRVLRTSR